MKKGAFKIALALAIALLLAGYALAAERTVVLTLPDMAWASIELQVQSVLGDIEGVLEYETDSCELTATVTYDDEAVSLDEIKKAFEEAEVSVSGAVFPEGG